ncbi:uncharacterized protein DNG_02261 [Cephalotrichum gorgonifer]|uniref:Uncharacterized protein n=1 Tax=Cephalotrichum gorgonifer TaxID=2041049 RepID=A0AAE8SSI1_9PEZI|nr:uncharacterized protein DNG_02261 [Cephalotrichum gorgonifer]
MKFILALLPVALAASKRRGCTPGTFQCEVAPVAGWSVCDTQGAWVRGGDCQSTEYCSMNPLNGAPYCIPAPPPTEECSPDTWLCVEDDNGWAIDVCEAGKWAEKVRCPEGQVCAYGAVRGYPYCTANPPW